MEKKNKIKKQHIEEIEELRIRLIEAEETMSAIRSGDVDAIIVAGLQGEQVFTLTGAERAYRVLIETMTEGAASLNREGIIIYCNQRLSEMLKTPLEKVIGTPLRQFIRVSDLMIFDSLIEKGAHESGKGEVAFINNAGGVLPVLLSISLLQKDNADICGITVTDLTAQKHIEEELGRHRDNLEKLVKDRTHELETSNQQLREEIAGRKRMEETLRESQQLLEGIINTIPVRVFWKDRNLVYLGCNAAFAYDAGFADPKDIIGKDDYQMGWRDQAELYRNDDRQVIEQGVTKYLIEEPQTNPEGNTITLLTSKLPLTDSKGEINGVLGTYIDITLRKKTEEALQESNEFNRQIIESAQEGIIVYGLDLKYQAWNPFMERLTGLSAAEVLGRHPLEVFPFLREAGVMTGIDKALAGAVSEAERFQFHVPKTGQSGWASEISAPLKNARGEIIGVISTIRDITDYARAEEALKEEKRFIENAINTLQEIFFVFDLEGRFLRWNKTLNAVTGYSDTEIALLKPTDLFRNDDIRKIADAIQEAVKVSSVSVDALFVTKDGRQIPYEFSAALLTDAHDKPIGISGVGRDITERKKSEVALRESEERFRQIAESTKEWIWEINCGGLFTYASHVVEEILGYKPEEVIGKKHFFDFFPSDKREQIKKEVLEFFATKKAFVKYVSPNVHKNGSIVLMETSGLPILDSRGDLLGYRGIKVDITEHRKLEDQLRQAQKMEAVGTLAGGIAHDFNNILNVIMGYGQMAMDSLEADSPSKDNMNEVLIAANRAANLTKRLLVFSRKQVAEVKPVNINELVLGLQKMLARIIRESIDINLDLADRPLIVEADAGQIEQVLMNLASNAKDAMPEGGCLTIASRLQEIDDEYVAAYGYGKPGTYALITVADTGHGMDAKTQKNIFEPFFTTKGVGEGTGLGLAISYGIIKQHNGYIKVYSEMGRGTTFKIWLPVIEDTAKKKPEIQSLSYPKGGTETILVAEDDVSLRKLSRIVLESSGYRVITAEDGEDAITKFMENREKVDLVMLDMIMPKKNGKEVGETIRKVSPRTKILFASGYTMDIIKTRELTESGFDFLLKPVVPRDLLRKVREILER